LVKLKKWNEKTFLPMIVGDGYRWANPNGKGKRRNGDQCLFFENICGL